MHLSPSDVANSVRMSRSVYKQRSALLVEGLKDVRFYRNVVHAQKCVIIPTEGKATAIGALELLRSSKVPGVLLILDLDFSALKGHPSRDSDIVFTDSHDLEGILLQPEVIDRVMIECDLEPGYFGQDLLTKLVSAALPIGYLRFLSERLNLALSFKNLDFNAFVKMDITTDALKLIDCVLRSNPSCQATRPSLLRAMNSAPNPTHDPLMVCCGHDISAILGLCISRATTRPLTGVMVERNLRLAYDFDLFRNTRMYAAIQQWEQRNVPFAVLR
jgi:hypothetical protein